MMERNTAVPEELFASLADGTRVLFRTIAPEDKGCLRAAFDRLSPESRYRRFFRQVDRVTERQLRYLTEIDYENYFAWVGLLLDEPGRPGIGVARWVRSADEPDVAEAAVTVVDAYQGQGVGKSLLYLATASAIERGVRYFRAWILGDNRPMRDLLTELGAVPGKWEQGVLEMIVPLPDDPQDSGRPRRRWSSRQPPRGAWRER